MTVRILIVEDHPTMREAMRLVFEGEGFEIDEAADGEAALHSIGDRPPDLLFLDMNIPGTNGADVLEAIRAEPSTAHIRVIVVTAAGEEGRADAMRRGADEYFTKPFSPTALLQTVERVLAGNATPEA
jgi:CheY-like chemotaxis protein